MERMFLGIGLFLFGVIWFPSSTLCETDLETCSFYYWRVSWASAVKTCERDHKKLLCYGSKRQIDDITEAFRLAAFSGQAELDLWLSSKNCSGSVRYEDCLSLHISKNSKGVWHYFEEECNNHYPFVCCVDEKKHTTNEISSSSTASDKDETSSAIPTSTESPFCKEIWRRGLFWPDTRVEKEVRLACPGNSEGTAKWSCKNYGWDTRGPDMRGCRSQYIETLKQKIENSTVTEFLRLLDETVGDSEREVFGEDLADVVAMMATLPKKARQFVHPGAPLNWTLAKQVVQNSTSVFDRLIELKSSWQDIAEEKRVAVGTEMLSTVEGLCLLVANSVEHNEGQSVIGRNMELQILKAKRGQEIALPQWSDHISNYSRQGNILIEKGFDSNLNAENGKVSVIFTLYKDLSHVLLTQQPANRKSESGSLNSAVVSATVAQGNQSRSISGRVRILVEHVTQEPKNSTCVFWNMQNDEWDPRGCRLEESNGSHSACVCDHLTNFAVLMDYESVLEDVDPLAFYYITVIGCSVSILCLAACVIAFSCYSHHSSKHSWGLRYSIHRNLCLTLLIANLVLVLGLDKTEVQDLCAVIAGVLHYFFLSSFSWMLLEGVHIYLLLVVVFASRRSHWEKYYLFGYGCPLVVVVTTAIARPNYYGTKHACWLSTEKGTIWAFMGPVAVILTVNLAALILAQWKASSIPSKEDSVILFKRWLRVTFILFPVLGVTWILGFMFVGSHFQVAGYLFAVLNSLQGFCIFLCHCILDQKARNSLFSIFKRKTAPMHTGTTGSQKKTSTSNRESLTGAKADPNQIQNSLQIKRSWINWKWPWSFCFEMTISESETRHNSSEESKHAPPKPVIVQWTNLKT